jgi:hypothetical protein
LRLVLGVLGQEKLLSIKLIRPKSTANPTTKNDLFQNPTRPNERDCSGLQFEPLVAILRQELVK